MKRNVWYRMYASILDLEDKTQELSDKHFRSWVKILALYTRNNGVMPADSAVARCLGLPLSKYAEVRKTLIDKGLIDSDGATIAPHNWDERQFESDSSADRMRRWRDGHKNCNGDVTGDVTVTSHVTRSENRVQRQRQSKTIPTLSSLPALPAKGEPIWTPEICKGILGYFGWKGAERPAIRKLNYTELHKFLGSLMYRMFPEEESDFRTLCLRHDWFCEFWAEYWLKVSEKEAFCAYYDVVTSYDLHETILAAVISQSPKQKEQPVKWQKHAHNWITENKWTDEVVPAEESTWDLR